MVDESRISAANGLIGLTTVFSTIVGTYAGSWLADFTGDKGPSPLAMVGAGAARRRRRRLGDELADRQITRRRRPRAAFPGTWRSKAGAT